MLPVLNQLHTGLKWCWLEIKCHKQYYFPAPKRHFTIQLAQWETIIRHIIFPALATARSVDRHFGVTALRLWIMLPTQTRVLDTVSGFKWAPLRKSFFPFYHQQLSSGISLSFFFKSAILYMFFFFLVFDYFYHQICFTCKGSENHLPNPVLYTGTVYWQISSNINYHRTSTHNQNRKNNSILWPLWIILLPETPTHYNHDRHR